MKVIGYQLISLIHNPKVFALCCCPVGKNKVKQNQLIYAAMNFQFVSL